MTPDGLVEQQDEGEDLFERIVERKPEKAKQSDKTESDNLFLRRKENKLQRAKAKQEVQRIERLIEQNDTSKMEAESALNDAQKANDYRKMQQLYETISVLNAEETELYERLEQAEEALKQIAAEDEL